MVTNALAEMDRLLGQLTGRHHNQLERFTRQVAFARALCDLHPEQEAAWQELIEQAVNQVRSELDAGRLEGLGSAIQQAEDALAPIGQVAKQYTMHCIGHAHIDMNWMWSWPETVAVTNDTFGSIDRLMEAYPEFCFTQGQASVYAATEKHHPELLERIRKHVAQGQWEVAASTWVEGDKNMAAGESLCRHLLYTRRYMKQLFDLDPEDVPIDWEPDTFGHPHTVPTFLARAGVTRYFMSRGGATPRPPVYWWKAPDGSRVLVIQQSYQSWPVPEDLALRVVDFSRQTGLKDCLCALGVGDHGGGPTRKGLEQLLEMDQWPVFPNIRLTTTDKFYQILEQHGDQLPVLDCELNFVFDGCYTSESNIKRANRFSEAALYEAEASASAAWALDLRDYPTDLLREAWINTLFNQFHDILPGSGVRATYDYAQGLFQETTATTGMVQTQSLRTMAASIDTARLVGAQASTSDDQVGRALGAGVGEGAGFGAVSTSDAGADTHRPFVVFNPCAWARSQIVTATLWDVEFDPKSVAVIDDQGSCYAAQTIEEGKYWGHEFVRVVFPAQDVPPLGYRTYVLHQGQAEPLQGDVVSAQPNTLENGLISVQFDAFSGGISQLLDKRVGVNLAAESDPLGGLEYAVERPHGMTAWTIGDIRESTRPLPAATLGRPQIGPYLATLSSTYKINDSLVAVRTSVSANDPCVQLTIKATWVERGGPQIGVPMLRIHFPLALENRVARYEIPYGTIVRDLPHGEEVPSQRWADLSGKASNNQAAGFALLNNCKYGHSVRDNVLRLTLIRSSYDPDILPEIGEQEIRLGLLPHTGEWGPADCVRSGMAFNHPLKVIGTGVHAGDFSPSASFLSLNAPNVILGSLKKAEDQEALLLRLYEVEGKDTDLSVELHPDIGGAFKDAQEVDLLERPSPEDTAEYNKGKLTVKVPGFGITSVKLTRG